MLTPLDQNIEIKKTPRYNVLFMSLTISIAILGLMVIVITPNVDKLADRGVLFGNAPDNINMVCSFKSLVYDRNVSRSNQNQEMKEFI